MDIKHLLNGDDSGTWYDVPGASKVKVKIKTLKPKRRREITKKHTRHKRFGGGLVEEVDNDAVQMEIMNEVIVGWEGIEMDDKPFEFSIENIKILDDNWPEFSTLWNRVVFKQTGLEEEIKESALGN
ncbi:hypothetical protein LCGC14_2759380 [marine sediment metagenome]|uniref:Uncharacterized protein n=1 Tax=marine sediment metagenome TaxID=412755 RepID=A0A0F8YZD3_9ZZZZ